MEGEQSIDEQHMVETLDQWKQICYTGQRPAE